jgi:hypothetical protein
MTISRSIIVRRRNVSDKILEKIKPHILTSITFSRKSCQLGDNVGKYGTARQARQRMRFVCWIPKGIQTHSEYEIHIDSAQQIWLKPRCLNITFKRTLPDLLVMTQFI